MFIPPVERARAKRQLRPTTTTPQSPFESFVSNILNPGAPTTTTRSTSSTRPQPSETLPTLPSLVVSNRLPTSTSTSTSSSTSDPTTSSTTPQRTTTSTGSQPFVTSLDSTTSTDDSTVVVTQTATSASPSGPGTSDASNNGDQPADANMTPLVKGIVISASVIFGLIFLALVIRKLFQFRRRQNRVSWAENISPFAPTANETGYEKPLPQGSAPIPVPTPPPSRVYGSQDVGYGPMMGTGRPSFGANPDQRNSHYSTTGTGYATYQNYPTQSQTMQPYAPATPYAYNPAGTGAGAVAAAVGGVPGLAYSNNTAAPPPAMPNPFQVSPMDAAGPVPISVPVAPQPILVVKRTFTPNLEDELSIATGESVRVVAVYDDGWCKVGKLGAGGEEGVVPYECLENPAAGALGGLGTTQDDIPKRASSVYDAPRA